MSKKSRKKFKYLENEKRQNENYFSSNFFAKNGLRAKRTPLIIWILLLQNQKRY